MRKMINYTRKWWLLGCHRRAERFYSTAGSADGRRILVSEDLFINGDKDNKGLVNKYNPFVRFRPSRLIFWNKEYSEEKLKVKRHFYSNLYAVCRREGYITDELGTQQDRTSFFPTVANEKAYNISGFPLGYFQGLFLTYDKVWLAIGALIIALIGSNFLVGTFIKNTAPAPAVVNVYPAITIPMVSTSTPPNGKG